MKLSVIFSVAAVALLACGVAACAAATPDVAAMVATAPQIGPPEIVTAMTLAAAVAPASASLEATEALGAKDASHPRVSLDDINAAIAAENYFTAGQAIERLGQPTNPAVDLLTLCILTTRSGFVVVGKSAPASPENFDAEKGRTFAREDAVRQLWPLMGFALRERLAEPKAA